MRRLAELQDCQGLVALITGGVGHIGRTMAETLAELGAAVAILDRESAAASLTASEIREEYGVPTLSINVDMADENSLRDVPQRVSASLGSLGILVNCAAFTGTTKLEGWAVPFNQQSSDSWRKALEVNLTAVFNLCQASRPYLEASGHGTIINVASTYGLVGPDMRLYEGTEMSNPAAYGASKGGLLQLTRYLATALAPDIRVNAITPGGVFRNQPQSFIERYESRTPMGRMATEEDFKGAVAYLASDLSAYVTGQNLVVDGGWTAW